jgi:DNA-binding SARP family transcriptional activator/tetratricopeptide (TPR) repeat protein
MHYRILGPLEVLNDEGRPIPLGGPRERVLLATLLLEAERVVSADRLIEALWGDNLPATAANALQVHVSKVRKKLAGPAGTEGPLHTEPPGYVLRVGAGELDSERFEHLAIESNPGEGPLALSARLAGALGLWRGRVLDGLEIDVVGRADVARLEELRVATVEARIQADLALGRHVRLVGELEGLVHTYPLRERLRAQLMVALYRSGRQADALAIYRNTREILAEELGIDPGQALQDLELAILNQSPELDLPIVRDLEAIEPKRSSETVSVLLSDVKNSARPSEQEPNMSNSLNRQSENVAVLFTDIVGSTELSPDVADQVRRGHFSILRQAITEAAGTEVKNLGDGLMVVFSSASAALACGVAMQQGVERDNRAREHHVGLRVGLGGGEVTREDNDYFGDPVVEAARLCALCDSGQVLATAIVRGMAGRRNRHECRSLGELVLKGLPDPVETVEVHWVSLGGADSGASIPLPSRLAIRPEVGVVGRAPEAEVLADAFKRAASGAGREVVLVSGEAGLGKSTIVAEVSRSAHEAGACVLFGHCEEELATPYQLFAEAVGHYVTHAPEEQLRAHVETHGSELVRLVPALASRIPDLPPSKATDSDTERYLLFAAVVGFVSMAAKDQPVVLVLDDLQWADKGSLLLLRHLAASEAPLRLLVLGTYRDSELSNAHSLVETLAALRRLSGVSRIGLIGFDDTGVMALMEAAAGHSLDNVAVGLAHAIYRETDGNPFFVSEVLRNLSETGAIYRDATGRWVSVDSLDGIALPDSVREVVGSRVVRLGRDAQRVLSVASVIGRDFDLDLLARATNTTDDDLLDILEAASTVALVREPADAAGRYNFSHALIQHTLYEDLGPNRRARVHRQVAEALEHLCADRPGSRVGELARHWFSATQPIDLGKAIRYSRQAADAALRALAPADAFRYYVQALDLYPQTTDPDPALGIDLAIGLGTAQRQTGNPDFRVTLLNAARRAADIGDTERLAAAVLANNRGVISSVIAIDTEKIEVLEAALDRLSTDNPDRALVLAALCSELTFESPHKRLQALADEAVAIAQSCDDDEVIVRVLNHVFDPLQVPPQLKQSLVRSADALIRAERVGDPVLLFFSAGFRAIAAARSGDITEMDRSIEIMGSSAEPLDQPIFTWALTMWRAGRALIAGDTDQAERLATEALQIGADSGQPDATLLFGMQFMSANLQRGTISDLVPLIEQMAAEMPGSAPASIAGAIAAAHVEGDRTEVARHLLEGFAASDFDLPLGQDWITGMVAFAEAAIECRDPKYAGPLFERLAPWADQWSCGTVTAEGPVSHFLGGLAAVLGRYDEADAYFAQAAASSGRAAAKFFAARTDLSWGRMCADRQAPGDIEKARDLLTKAHTVASTLGYGTVERRAAAALQSLN